MSNPRNYGTVELPDGRVINLSQDAYCDNDSDGDAAWFASGYLSTEDPDDETGPTVNVCWMSLGADEPEDDADWSRPISVTHYRLGNLL